MPRNHFSAFLNLITRNICRCTTHLTVISTDIYNQVATIMLLWVSLKCIRKTKGQPCTYQFCNAWGWSALNLMKYRDCFIISYKRITAFFKQRSGYRSKDFVSFMRKHLTIPPVVSIPEEKRNTTFYLNTRKTIRCFRKIMNDSYSIIVQHFVTEFIQSFSTGKPSRRRYHNDESRIQFFCALYKQLIDWSCACTVAAPITQLIRRIPYNHIYLSCRFDTIKR